MVSAAVEALRGLGEWTAETIEAALEQVRKERGWSRAKFFSPIRWCAAGRISPPLHQTLALLSREEALRRLEVNGC